MKDSFDVQFPPSPAVCVCVLDIDRSQVLKNILTLNPLREDHSWIQGGKRNKDPEPQR